MPWATSTSYQPCVSACYFLPPIDELASCTFFGTLLTVASKKGEEATESPQRTTNQPLRSRARAVSPEGSEAMARAASRAADRSRNADKKSAQAKKRKSKTMKRPPRANTSPLGSTLESLFDELGEREEFDILLQKKLLALRVETEMKRQQMTKQELAKRMSTSRTSVYRLLNPQDTGVTFDTLMRASRALNTPLLMVRSPRASYGVSKPGVQHRKAKGKGAKAPKKTRQRVHG
jgi:antitoxin HicB